MLLDDVNSEADATGVAERIHEELAAPLVVRGHEMFTSVSVGIALSSAGYERPEDMLRDADTAMYRAKAGGRARHQVFAGDMHQRAVSSLRLETDLRRALERREIVPYYQPIVDLDDGEVLGFEALARWRHPTLGLLPPDLFIPVAEETGLVGPIGDWMLTEACRQAREWQRSIRAGRRSGISVNVSGRQLLAGDVAADVERALGASGLDPACLTLEITESALMHNLNAGAGMMQRLHAMSVGLHLDDFGTGYSSLAYLHSFPVARAQGRSIVRRPRWTGRRSSPRSSRRSCRWRTTSAWRSSPRGSRRVAQADALARPRLPARTGLPVLAPAAGPSGRTVARHRGTNATERARLRVSIGTAATHRTKAFIPFPFSWRGEPPRACCP